MFLNCKFIHCYIKSMFDYFLGTQKAPVSWNDTSKQVCKMEEPNAFELISVMMIMLCHVVL